MAEFQPPPTWAEPVLINERTRRGEFNPVWLKWFLDIVQIINNSGGGGGIIVHNNTSGIQGGAANDYYHFTGAQHTALLALPTFASGTYTPTLTNTTNLSASTAYLCQYSRLGSFVTVSGKVDIDPTAAGSCVLGVSLPIASNFGAVTDCGGAAACPTIAGQSAAILGDAANDRATMQWIAVDITNQPMYFTFAYRII